MKFMRFAMPFVIAMLVSGLAYVAYSYRHAYYALTTAYSQLESKYYKEQAALDQRSSLWHGKLLRVDPTAGVIVLEVTNQSIAGISDVPLTILVKDSTLFIRQHLVADKGSYIGFSETLEGSITDLAAGMLIAVSFERDPESRRAIAEFILYGGAF